MNSEFKRMMELAGLLEIRINKPTSAIDKFFWLPDLYNFFKNDQDIFKNSGIDSIIKINLNKIIDNIWDRYQDVYQEYEEEEYNDGDITDYPKTRDDLLDPNKHTGGVQDAEYFEASKFLFPYILKHLKENGWEQVNNDTWIDAGFSKDGKEVDIFDYIKPFAAQDTSPRENLYEKFVDYIEDNY